MPYPLETVLAIARKHGLHGELRRLPDSGMVNEAWLIGENYVLRINTREDTEDESERESLVVPLVRAAGVRSPELIAYNPDKDIVDQPYTIYERAKGELLGHLEDDPAQFGKLYREVGKEIAFLNRIEIPESVLPKLREDSTLDAEKQIEKALEAKAISQTDAKEVAQRIELLKQIQNRRGCPINPLDLPHTSTSGSPPPSPHDKVFIHRDIHPWNLFVDAQTHVLTAIIDWGDAALGHPATEFASMPLIALPEMLEGYEEAGGDTSSGFVPRALELGLALALWEIRGLDPARFARRWWRHPPGGWSEAWAKVDSLLETYC